MNAIISLGDDLVTMPSSTCDVHQVILNTPDAYPYFKDALGAIDGTHIPVIIPRDRQDVFRNRHGFPSQNVMAVVLFDLQFQYVCAGLEGYAADMRVLKHCMDVGKYYLVDAGHANTYQLLAPYRGERYHLSTFQGSARQYSSPKEKFNHVHAHLRNCVERAFGVLKRRCKILRMSVPYSIETQRDIVKACAILHNYIGRYKVTDRIFDDITDSAHYAGEL